MPYLDEVVRQLMKHGPTDLVLEVGVGREVLQQWNAEQGDLVREGHEVRAPLGPRSAFVQAVQVVGIDVAAALAQRQLFARRPVLDDDRDILECPVERRRDPFERPLDQGLEAIARSK